MPDQLPQDVKLTEDQKKQAIDFLQAHLKDRPLICPICGVDDWFIGDHLVIPIAMSLDYRVMIGGGPTYPHIMVISKRCGYTMFVNAVIIEILPGTKPPEENPSAKKG